MTYKKYIFTVLGGHLHKKQAHSTKIICDNALDKSDMYTSILVPKGIRYIGDDVMKWNYVYYGGNRADWDKITLRR